MKDLMYFSFAVESARLLPRHMLTALAAAL